jgi:hypothetical protein
MGLCYLIVLVTDSSQATSMARHPATVAIQAAMRLLVWEDLLVQVRSPFISFRMILFLTKC